MPVGDVALAQVDRRLQRLVADFNLVVGFVPGPQTLQYLQRSLGIGLADEDRLQASLQGFVLLDELAVIVQRGGTDTPQLTVSQCRLEHGAGVDGAFGGASADYGMNLVDE